MFKTLAKTNQMQAESEKAFFAIILIALAILATGTDVMLP